MREEETLYKIKNWNKVINLFSCLFMNLILYKNKNQFNNKI